MADKFASTYAFAFDSDEDESPIIAPNDTAVVLKWDDDGSSSIQV